MCVQPHLQDHVGELAEKRRRAEEELNEKIAEAKALEAAGGTDAKPAAMLAAAADGPLEEQADDDAAAAPLSPNFTPFTGFASPPLSPADSDEGGGPTADTSQIAFAQSTMGCVPTCQRRFGSLLLLVQRERAFRRCADARPRFGVLPTRALG